MLDARTAAGVRAVVLVHGGFVDRSGWQGVYKSLVKKGYTVDVVQNPTASLADDVAVTRRILDRHKGPVVLVGHSYGGVVVTEAEQAAERRGNRLHRGLRSGQGGVCGNADCQSGSWRAGAPNPATSGRIPPPRPGEVRRVVCGGRQSRHGLVHGRLSGAVGSGSSRRRNQRASVDGEAELVPRSNR